MYVEYIDLGAALARWNDAIHGNGGSKSLVLGRSRQKNSMYTLTQRGDVELFRPPSFQSVGVTVRPR